MASVAAAASDRPLFSVGYRRWMPALLVAIYACSFIDRLIVSTVGQFIKVDLKLLADAAFDRQLIVGDRPYGADLVRWIRKNAPDLPTDPKAKVVPRFPVGQTSLRQSLKRIGRGDEKHVLDANSTVDLALWQAYNLGELSVFRNV